MTLAELKTILSGSGFPVRYSHFDKKDAPPPPYITYIDVFSSNFGADNRTYHKISNIQIELYTKKKDLSAEAALEQVLNEAELFFDTTETYIDSEKVYQKIYEVGL